MEINATLLVEIFTFATLIFLTMKYIWPPMLKAIEERQKKIADGLAAGERGEKALELAKQKIKEQLQKTKAETIKTIGQANKQAACIIENAKHEAEKENKKILALAKTEIAAEQEKAKLQLRNQISDLVITISAKVLEKSDPNINKNLIDKFIEEI
jgi:F-type H+-transporting ATPase subunit b